MMMWINSPHYDGQNNQIKFVKNTENQVSKAQLLNPNGTLYPRKKL